jgi:hypothetical protein
MMESVGTMLGGDVMVVTTEGRGFTPEEIAERALFAGRSAYSQAGLFNGADARIGKEQSVTDVLVVASGVEDSPSQMTLELLGTFITPRRLPIEGVEIPVEVLLGRQLLVLALPQTSVFMLLIPHFI